MVGLDWFEAVWRWFRLVWGWLGVGWGLVEGRFRVGIGSLTVDLGCGSRMGLGFLGGTGLEVGLSSLAWV